MYIVNAKIKQVFLQQNPSGNSVVTVLLLENLVVGEALDC